MKLDHDKFNKTNIIFVINNFSAKGGAERVLRDLTSNFVNDHNIIMVSYNKSCDTHAYELHSEINWIKLGGKFNNRYLDYLNCTFKLFKLLLFIKNKSKVIGWLYLAYFPIAVFKFLGFDKDISYYGSEHIFYNHYNIFQKVIINFSMLVMDKTIFVSEYAKNTFVRIKDSKKIVIPNILHLEKGVLNKLKKNNNHFLKKNNIINICSVGRLTDQKNFFEAIETIRLLISTKGLEVTYHIYGVGKYFKKLDEYIQKFNLTDFIELKGLVSPVPYSKYDITFVPSNYETQCLVILESWNSGTPVFMYSRLKRMLDFVKIDESAFLIEDKLDIKSIVNYLKTNSKQNSSIKCQENLDQILTQQKFIKENWAEILKN
jgi:glycosyltransferase involved in cell wall biosynthesis